MSPEHAKFQSLWPLNVQSKQMLDKSLHKSTYVEILNEVNLVFPVYEPSMEDKSDRFCRSKKMGTKR